MAKETNKKETKKVIKEENNKKAVKKVKEESTKKVSIKKQEMPKFIEFIDKYRLCIYGIVGGVLATILVVILIWPDRIAKLEDGKEPVAQIDNLTVTADDLYESMKEVYSISLLLDKIDNKILEEKYPDNEEMTDDVKEQAESYYKMYEQYYGTSKEEFLSGNGFGSEKAFLEYLKLQYRRDKYTEEYAKSLVTDKEIDKYYEDKVYGDIKTKHILVKVNEDATDEEKEEAENLAKEIISKLDDGKTFDEVKEEYKDSITYEELGYKSYNASLESAYMEEMQNLKNDSYSKKPVKTSYGYHIVYRIDQKDKPTLKDVKEDIITTLAEEKLSSDTTISSTSLAKLREEVNLKFSDTVLESKYNAYLAQNK